MSLYIHWRVTPLFLFLCHSLPQGGWTTRWTEWVFGGQWSGWSRDWRVRSHAVMTWPGPRKLSDQDNRTVPLPHASLPLLRGSRKRIWALPLYPRNCLPLCFCVPPSPLNLFLHSTVPQIPLWAEAFSCHWGLLHTSHHLFCFVDVHTKK